MQLGIKDIEDSIRAVVVSLGEEGVKQDAAFRAGVFLTAQDVLAATAPNVPKKSGTLLDSRVILRTWPITIEFKAWYSAIVHEVEQQHPVGRWKYLQVTLAESESWMLARIASHTRSARANGWTIANVPASFPETADAGAAPARRRKGQAPRVRGRQSARWRKAK